MADAGGGPANAIGKGVDFVASQALSKAGSAIGSVFGPAGTAVGYAVGSVAGRAVKYIVAVIAGAVILFVLFIITIIVPIEELLTSSTSGVSAGEIMTVTKTADRNKLANDDPNPNINYTISITNKTPDPITSISVSDDKCSAINYSIAQLAAGANDTKSFVCAINVGQHDSVLSNTVTVTGTLTTTNSDGSQTSTPLNEKSPAVVVTIGTPPECPPAFSPLKGPEVLIGEGNDYLTPVSYGAHQGVDIHTTGSDWNVYSPFPCQAIVETVGDYGTVSYGKYIVLQSGGWTTLMAHLGSFAVQVGQTVSQDSVLGVMDSTGNSTGPHVHYEIKEAGTLVNPHDYGALIPHQ